jgi:hypothetical protein
MTRSEFQNAVIAVLEKSPMKLDLLRGGMRDLATEIWPIVETIDTNLAQQTERAERFLGHVLKLQRAGSSGLTRAIECLRRREAATRGGPRLSEVRACIAALEALVEEAR